MPRDGFSSDVPFSPVKPCRGIGAGLALLATACASTPAATPETSWVAEGRQGMVVSDSPHASRAGLSILQAGGNAVDAAAATSFALAVTRPYSAGLGGGGFLMLRLAGTGEVHILDYRECAPAAATAELYAQAARESVGFSKTQYMGLAAGVPGLVAGHAAMLERFGTRSLQQVVEPANLLAGDGFPIDSHFAGTVRSTVAVIAKHEALAAPAGTLKNTLLFAGRPVEAGEILRQPALAETLRAIGAQGPAHFYRGPIGESLARTVQAAGGLITTDDFARYRPAWRKPLRVRYRERYELLLMPPPSSGGVCIAETLNILEHWDLRSIHRDDPGLAAHLTIEALKHAFADRSRHLGDSDFADVPVEMLTSKQTASRLAERIRLDKAGKPDTFGAAIPDDSGTTHFCVADRGGNIVSVTETINTAFGSLLMDEATGIVLNNEMDDFTTAPGRANAFGLMQSDRNAVARFKRPLSSMSPTICLADGKPILAVGASGGPRIITGTLQVLLDVIEYGRPLPEAVERPRLHHQWYPDLVYRNGLPEDDPAIVGLVRRGHVISSERRTCTVQSLQIDGDRFIGVSDPRKGGEPAGF